MTARAGRSAAIVVLAVAALAAPLTPAAGAAKPASARAASYEQTVAAAVALVQGYWKQNFPKLYGARYVPVPPKRVIAARPGVVIPPCQGQRLSYDDVVGNAFYCYEDNFIAYDDVGLMPALFETFGPFSLALVFAHEWGHAIQDRAGNADEQTIYKELQADCFAGAWSLDRITGRGAAKLQPGDLETSVAALLELRDAPGTSPDDPSAHGSAFDRVSAFQEGFESGAERCAAYFDDLPLLVELPFSSEEEAASGGDLPADEVIPLAVELLDDFYGQVEQAYESLTLDDIGSFDSSKKSTIPKCGGTKLTVEQVENRVFYCIDDGYVAFDEPFLQSVYDQIGDFGVMSLFANPWATHVQVLQGEEGVASNDLAIVFQADCYTGGWTAAIANGFLAGGSLSPGDLDEFVEAYLVYSRARGVSEDVPITFFRIGYFRRGLLAGYDSCDLATIQDEVKDL